MSPDSDHDCAAAAAAAPSHR
eukprot:SAG11_NODE_24131_length_376_cov_3.586331_2_plen_20_part_01